MYPVPGKFPNIPVWRGVGGVPKGPKCENAHESGPKCESRELARRANESQMWSTEKPGRNEEARRAIEFADWFQMWKSHPILIVYLEATESLKIHLCGAWSPAGPKKSGFAQDLGNIPVWRRGWGGSQKVPNVKSDTVAVPNVKHPLWLNSAGSRHNVWNFNGRQTPGCTGVLRISVPDAGITPILRETR